MIGLPQLAFAILALALPASAAAPVESPPALQIADDVLASADVVILGEIHDDPAHHRIQGEVIRRMVELGRPPSVVFEMVPADLQGELDRLGAAGPAALDEVDRRLSWSERGWGDPSLYRPVFEAALAAGLPLRAGDLEKTEIRRIASQGADALAADRRRRLGLDVTLDPALDADLRDLLVASHCGMMTADDVGPLVLVQRARDGALADAVRLAAGNGPVVLITGQGHARRDWGVPAVLGRVAPDLAVLSVALSPDGTDPEGGFDLTIPTGAAPDREDPCEAMRSKG